MNLEAAVLSIGVLNINTGKGQYDWTIYDQPKSCVFLTDHGFLLLAQPTTFEIGDTVRLRGNDSRRLIKDNVGIKDVSVCVKEEVLAMLKKNGYDYYPIMAFKARPKGNRKLGTSYSIKGTTEA